MKKFLSLLVLPVCLLVCACTQNADDPINVPLDTYTGTELSAEKELEIRQAFFEKFKSDSRDKLENVQIEGFWGAYNGAYAVYFGCGLLDAIEEITVEDIDFIFPNQKALAYVYKDGEFYSFNEAYDSGLLTLDDFRAVHRLYEQTMRETTGWKI